MQAVWTQRQAALSPRVSAFEELLRARPSSTVTYDCVLHGYLQTVQEPLSSTPALRLNPATHSSISSSQLGCLASRRCQVSSIHTADGLIKLPPSPCHAMLMLFMCCQHERPCPASTAGQYAPLIRTTADACSKLMIPYAVQQSRRQTLSRPAAHHVFQLADALPILPETTVPVSKIPGGWTTAEGLIVLAPIVLYGLFSVYRDRINPNFKLSDFALIVAGLVVLGNVAAILIFKTRLY